MVPTWKRWILPFSVAKRTEMLGDAWNHAVLQGSFLVINVLVRDQQLRFSCSAFKNEIIGKLIAFQRKWMQSFVANGFLKMTHCNEILYLRTLKRQV